mgnify:CR=1 FL=1
MLINLLLGFFTISVCLLLQSMLLMAALRYYRGHDRDINNPSYLASLIVINGVLLLLVLGNLGQVAVWALLFQWLGEFERFADAYYHSAVNFATLGYGDVVMSPAHRLLGAIEAINGVLMIGISTAVLMSVFQDAMRRTIEARGQGV